MKDNNKIEMELTDTMVEKIKETFDLEIELLKGEKTKLENGMWKIVVYVSDAKLVMFKDLVNMLMSLNTDQVKVKIMGVELNKN